MTDIEIAAAAEEEGWMPIKEAIQFLGITRTAVYDEIAKGTLITRKLRNGRRTLLLRASVKALARKIADGLA